MLAVRRAFAVVAYQKFLLCPFFISFIAYGTINRANFDGPRHRERTQITLQDKHSNVKLIYSVFMATLYYFLKIIFSFCKCSLSVPIIISKSPRFCNKGTIRIIEFQRRLSERRRIPIFFRNRSISSSLCPLMGAPFNELNEVITISGFSFTASS